MLLQEIMKGREIHKFRKKPRRLAGLLRKRADKGGNAEEIKGMKALGGDHGTSARS